jgi:adenylate cyclase
VVSRWERGEARDGADRGILVPVRFEGASLPIDVRALHTTGLDAWGEDPRSPQAQEVLRALGAIINAKRESRPAGAASEVAPSEELAQQMNQRALLSTHTVQATCCGCINRGNYLRLE